MGDLTYETRICAFVDILGFGRTVKGSVNEAGEPIAQEINRIASFLKALVHYTRPIGPGDLRSDRMVTQFSDSLVISYPCTAESEVFFSLLDLLHCCLAGVRSNLLLRGGVAVGPMLHTDDIVFGPALVSAYEMESKQAFFPRIIVHKDVISAAALAHAQHHTPEMEVAEIAEIVMQDTDGCFYIDYLGAAQSEFDDPDAGIVEHMADIARMIRAGLKDPDPRTVAKYLWLQQKYNALANSFVRRCAEEPHLQELYGTILPVRDS